ncbi:hypothetical protein ABGB17_28800 [Sphaerisporangium sp. B11E5]|uniref:hypothetical protein n=1 Tax=Sphaerisporangium sp. B11E5 TaxID=3153563 RepID=UPI00325CEAB4
MTEFFTAPPPRESAPVVERPSPAWTGPPSGVLGAMCPLDVILFQSDDLVIALPGATVFPEGAKLHVRMGVRRRAGTDDNAWRTRRELVMRGPHHVPLHPGAPLDDALLRLGVRFPDGGKATTVDGRPDYDEWPPPRPDHPVLRFDGGGGGSGASDDVATGHWSLWLWPLPPPERFEFAVEWPSCGVPLTFTALDGQAIVAAAGRARPFWP